MISSKLKRSVEKIPGLGYVSRLAYNTALLPRHIRSLNERQANHSDLLQRLVDQSAALQTTLAQLSETQVALNEHLTSLDHRLTNLSSQARPAPAVKQSADANKAGSPLFADNHALDQFYLDFENKFRGSEAEIQERLQRYVPIIAQTQPTKSHPVLDVGCGRGEMLAVMRDHHLPALGLDINDKMIERANKLGYDVELGEVGAFLADKPSASYSAITGFHLVEHIPFDRLLNMFDDCFRALRQGGLVIFETPNPENLIVGSCNFRNDPSHLNPLPPAVLKFALESRGFTDCQILRLHPMRELPTPTEPLSSETQLLNDVAGHVFGPQDYAVIGKKP